MKAWSITPEEVSRANQLAEIMSSEINVRAINIPIGTDEQEREVALLYKHSTLRDKTASALDIYAGREPQGKKDFAAWLFLESVIGVGL